MKKLKVRLYIRVRLSDGRSAYLDPAYNKNHTLRSGYALVKGSAAFHREGVYYLRFLSQGKRVWQSVGSDADAAIVALRNAEHKSQSIALGLSSPTPAVPKPAKLALSDAVDTYLAEVRRFRSRKTIAACQRMLTLFSLQFPGKAVAAITREDLLDHMSALKALGLADRTIHNHIMRIGALLRANKIVGLLNIADKPRYDEKEVEAYTADDLSSLFAAANPEELMLFQFFVGTGLREQEVMYTTWGNIQFKSNVVTVRSKPELGFRIKDHEERSVPVPDALMTALLKRKASSTSMLVFPGPTGKPNGHFLRTLQRLALRAGLNCGECVSKNGKVCSAHPVCRRWGLHKFRRTFATLHNESQVPISTLRLWLGHADLATSLRYLAAADLRSERTRTQVNASFAVLESGRQTQPSEKALGA